MRNLEDNTKSSRFFISIIKMYLCIINMNISSSIINKNKRKQNNVRKN